LIHKGVAFGTVAVEAGRYGAIGIFLWEFDGVAGKHTVNAKEKRKCRKEDGCKATKSVG
jgi:hypothetical protein